MLLQEPEIPAVGLEPEVPEVVHQSVRVRTLAVSARDWGWSPSRIAEEYDLTAGQVEEALEFARQHEKEIAADLAAEGALEAASA